MASSEEPARRHEARPGFARRVVRPVAWAFYVVIVFEILFMISPFALHFYAAYGPALDLLHRHPGTTWLTKFYLPHFTVTGSPLLNALHGVGGLLIVTGLAGFVAAAVPIYRARLRGRGPVTGGLYAAIRHPQYLALTITGVGCALVWPRFLVLTTLVTMLFLYVLLADWEEERCAARFGESYRRYQRRTGRFIPRALARWLPRLAPASGLARRAALGAAYLVAVPVAIALGFELRDWSLAQVAALYEADTAVISTAHLRDDELRTVYRTARAEPRVAQAVGGGGDARFIVYVVPEAWSLPDLPLDPPGPPGGHRVPSDFDRTRYKVLFTRARLHGTPPAGADIVKAAHGREPLIVAHVDAGARQVVGVAAPPPHVRWGDISTPMF